MLSLSQLIVESFIIRADVVHRPPQRKYWLHLCRPWNTKETAKMYFCVSG